MEFEEAQEYARNMMRVPRIEDFMKAPLKIYEGSMQLDPNDPFDSAVIKLVAMNRKKRADYAADSDWASNFRDVASNLALSGFGAAESALVLLLTKVARLRSLRLNGRMEDPSNESVLDTYLDLAVYSIIVYALVSEGSDD